MIVRLGCVPELGICVSFDNRSQHHAWLRPGEIPRIFLDPMLGNLFHC